MTYYYRLKQDKEYTPKTSSSVIMCNIEVVYTLMNQ